MYIISLIFAFIFGFALGLAVLSRYNAHKMSRPRCEIITQGIASSRCDLKSGHSGPHHGYWYDHLNFYTKELWWHEGDVLQRF